MQHAMRDSFSALFLPLSLTPLLSLWADTWLSAAIFTTFCAVLFHSVHIISFSLSLLLLTQHTHTQPPKFAAASHSRGPATPIKRIYSSNGGRGSDCDCCCDSSLCLFLFLLLFSVILWAPFARKFKFMRISQRALTATLCRPLFLPLSLSLWAKTFSSFGLWH